MKATPKPLKKRKIQNETKRNEIHLQPPKARPPKAKPLDPQNLRASHRNTRSRRMQTVTRRDKNDITPHPGRGVEEREKTRAIIDSFARENVLRAKVKETKKKRWNKRERTEERQARGRTRIRLFWWRRSVVASRTLKKKKKFPFLSKPKGVTFIWDSKKITGLYIHAYYKGTTVRSYHTTGTGTRSWIYIYIYTCNYVLKYKFIPLILVIVQLCSRVFLLRRKGTAPRRTYFSLLNFASG